MKYRLKTISPIQTSKVYAVVFLPLYLIYALFGFLMLLNPGARGEGVFLVLTPIWMGIIFFMAALIGCWSYNFFASRLGGIEFDLEPQE